MKWQNIIATANYQPPAAQTNADFEAVFQDFTSKHLRLKQCYSVYYYYHTMSAYRLSYSLTAVMTL